MRVADAGDELDLLHETMVEVCGVSPRLSFEMIKLAVRCLDTMFIDGALHRPLACCRRRYIFVALSLVLRAVPQRYRASLDHSLLYTLSGFASHADYLETFLAMSRDHRLLSLISFSPLRALHP